MSVATALYSIGLGTTDIAEFTAGELAVVEEGMEPDDEKVAEALGRMSKQGA